MSECIRLERRELVWECRTCDYTEEMFEDWKQGTIDYLLNNRVVNKDDVKRVMDAFTWQVAKDYVLGELSWEDEEAFDIKIDDYIYNNMLEWFRDDIREYNYNCDICSEEYADDFDEDWFIIDPKNSQKM